jgi:uncharacterized protein YkwD
MSISGLGRRAAAAACATAVTAGLVVTASTTTAAAQACVAGADLDSLQLVKTSTKAGGWSGLDRQVEHRSGKVRARVTVQGTVKTRAKYRATGTVQKCDGAGAKQVTVEGIVTAPQLRAASAAEVRSTKRQAVVAAKSAAKDKVRAKGTRATKRAVKGLAREAARNQLLAKAGVAPASPAPDATALASKIFALVNAERAKANLPALKYLPQFVPSATTWANTLVDGPFDHDPNLKAEGDALGCNKRPGGFANAFLEAIAKGDFSVAGTSTPSVDSFAQTVVDAWMASSTHKPILLSSATTYAGIGSVYRNKVWTVVYRSAAADCSNITGY